MRNLKIFIATFIITLVLFSAAGCFVMLFGGSDEPKENIETVFMPAVNQLISSPNINETIKIKPAPKTIGAGDMCMKAMRLNKRMTLSALLMLALNLPWPF